MFKIETNLPTVIGDFTKSFSKTDQTIQEISKGLAVDVLHNIQGPPPEGCPVDTGTLKRGHFVRLVGSQAAELYCSIYYWIYVVFGHRQRATHTTTVGKYTATYLGQQIGGTFKGGNDYPTRALQKTISSGAYDKIVKDAVYKHMK